MTERANRSLDGVAVAAERSGVPLVIRSAVLERHQVIDVEGDSGPLGAPGSADDAAKVALVALEPIPAMGWVPVSPAPVLRVLLGQVAEVAAAATAPDLLPVRRLARANEVDVSEQARSAAVMAAARADPVERGGQLFSPSASRTRSARATSAAWRPWSSGPSSSMDWCSARW